VNWLHEAYFGDWRKGELEETDGGSACLLRGRGHWWDIDEIDIRVEKDTISKIDYLRPEVVINVAAYTMWMAANLSRMRLCYHAEG